MIGERIVVWHFTKEDGTTSYLKEAEEVGKLYTVKGLPRCCQNGFHGSVSALDALSYAPGFMAGRRQLGGKFDKQSDKLCATKSVLLSPRVDAKNVLLIFAADCAERVLHLFEEEYPNDKRPRQAIETLRAYVRGEATLEDVGKAANAAFAADAADAAADAAHAAAHAAFAAHAAAHAAFAGHAAAHAAANAAANAAHAAHAAGFVAEKQWQREELEKRLLALFEAESTDDGR